MGELGIHRAGNDLCVDLPELFNAVTESHNLCGTHKCAEKTQDKKVVRDIHLFSNCLSGKPQK